MKPPAIAKPTPGAVRGPQASPTQALRTPPTVKPSSKAGAPAAQAGPPLNAVQSQVASAVPSPAVPVAREQRSSLPTATWPCTVPSQEEASRLLGGEGSEGKHDETIESLWNSLTDVELGALLERPSPIDLSALKEAVIVRWRLSNALETKPGQGAPIEMSALERLLREADAALAQLQMPEEGSETMRAGFASARAALAKDAVALSNFAAEVAQHAAAEAATNKATKKYEQVARLVRSSADTAKVALRSKVLFASLAIAVLGAGAFHGYRYLHAKNAPAAGPSYSAAGMHGFKNESSGITVLHAVDPTKPIDPAALAKLKAEAEANGKTVHEVGPGQYLITPSKLRVAGDLASQPSKGQP